MATMNAAFDAIIGASDEERKGVFLTAGSRMNTSLALIEKDFWVCWTLDAVFNGLPKERPRFLFKGGTSLSKAFDLIERFSEDIDLVVFRDDIGEAATAEAMKAMSNSKRKQKLEAIKKACHGYIANQMIPQLTKIVSDTMAKAKIPSSRWAVEQDPEDPDGQNILLTYPRVASENETSYVEGVVRIEAGARSALDPHQDLTIEPYVNQDVATGDLLVTGVTTLDPGRTFWDKIIILHGLRQWYDRKDELRHGGQRISRHYYDVHALLADGQAGDWLADTKMAEDCAHHARLFFGSPHYGLELATPGSFTLMPTDDMREALAADYTAMAGMIFAKVPPLDEVLARVGELEKQLNGGKSGSPGSA